MAVNLLSKCDIEYQQERNPSQNEAIATPKLGLISAPTLIPTATQESTETSNKNWLFWWYWLIGTESNDSRISLDDDDYGFDNDSTDNYGSTRDDSDVDNDLVSSYDFGFDSDSSYDYDSDDWFSDWDSGTDSWDSDWDSGSDSWDSGW